MPYRWGELVVIAAALIPWPLRAQQMRELGVQGILALSDPVVAVAAGYGALRVSGRTRLSGSLGAGVSAGALAWRAEVLGHFLLSPEERRRPGFYLAGGVAGVGDGKQQGYLVMALGLESRPGGRSGWAVELGVGGGFRAAAGYRWRYPSTQLQ